MARTWTFSEAYLTAKNSGRIEASYAERLESGVALLSFSRMAAAGPATLHFAYTAPFNDSGNALYGSSATTSTTRSPSSRR